MGILQKIKKDCQKLYELVNTPLEDEFGISGEVQARERSLAQLEEENRQEN